jgi:hypothetical protein
MIPQVYTQYSFMGIHYSIYIYICVNLTNFDSLLVNYHLHGGKVHLE